MKLSASRDVLLKPLQAVIGVVERRQTMPILSNVLLVAKEGELSVTATDLEVELVAQAARGCGLCFRIRQADQGRDRSDCVRPA